MRFFRKISVEISTNVGVNLLLASRTVAHQYVRTVKRLYGLIHNATNNLRKTITKRDSNLNTAPVSHPNMGLHIEKFQETFMLLSSVNFLLLL